MMLKLSVKSSTWHQWGGGSVLGGGWNLRTIQVGLDSELAFSLSHPRPSAGISEISAAEPSRGEGNSNVEATNKEHLLRTTIGGSYGGNHVPFAATCQTPQRPPNNTASLQKGALTPFCHERTSKISPEKLLMILRPKVEALKGNQKNVLHMQGPVPRWGNGGLPASQWTCLTPLTFF